VSAVDYEGAVEEVISGATEGRGMAVSALAVHGVMTGVLDPAHRYRLNRFDLIVPDGQPVRWALNLMHRTGLPERVYGPTLMLKLCEAASRKGLPIYLYGSRPEVLDRLRANLVATFPGLVVAGAQPSRFRRLSPEEKREVIEEIRSSGAALAFVGLGCPRQEVWAYEYREPLGMPIVAVGAAFDFHSGTLPQAPAAMQARGLEWLYRLGKEPLRLWRRYLYLNPLYLALLGAQFLGLMRFEKDPARAPEELSFG
jgi:N-acetylglucosaminyldiphosphoundecaprenol N-acetyl-beta-D-mannosaminyltransferase